MARDDLFIGGNTIEEVMDNWGNVLTKIGWENLNVTTRKVCVFLPDTEVFGHRITDGSVITSDHNIKTLAKTTTENLSTKKVNSWRACIKP